MEAKGLHHQGEVVLRLRTGYGIGAAWRPVAIATKKPPWTAPTAPTTTTATGEGTAISTKPATVTAMVTVMLPFILPSRSSASPIPANTSTGRDRRRPFAGA